jgi:chromate transporter
MTLLPCRYEFSLVLVVPSRDRRAGWPGACRDRGRAGKGRGLLIAGPSGDSPGDRVPLRTIAAQWTRIGCLGFGGPPAHIALLRALCVRQRGWLSAEEFEDGIAAANLLPGPASTQLSIFCAWRLAGPVGAVIGGACFILPGLIVILGLAALFLAAHQPAWVSGAAAGAGAAVPAVAAAAAFGLMPASWKRAGESRQSTWPLIRWACYLVVGGLAGALAGAFLVLVLAACGLLEMAIRVQRHPAGRPAGVVPVLLAGPAAAGGLLALAWVAFKVGALSYGGGFVIVPLMQHDAVYTYHWMTGAQFLSAVALGQVTPGPVVQTVAVVGYAAAGVGGGLLAALIAFAPSFAFILVGAPRFAALRRNPRVQAFLTGAGPAAIGAIAGSTVPLGLELAHLWQFAVLGLAAVWLLALRKNVVAAIVGAAVAGIVAALAGAPVG